MAPQLLPKTDIAERLRGAYGLRYTEAARFSRIRGKAGRHAMGYLLVRHKVKEFTRVEAGLRHAQGRATALWSADRKSNAEFVRAQ